MQRSFTTNGNSVLATIAAFATPLGEPVDPRAIQGLQGEIERTIPSAVSFLIIGIGRLDEDSQVGTLRQRFHDLLKTVTSRSGYAIYTDRSQVKDIREFLGGSPICLGVFSTLDAATTRVMAEMFKGFEDQLQQPATSDADALDPMGHGA